MIRIFTITHNKSWSVSKNIFLFIGLFLFLIGVSIRTNAQCATPPACSGTSVSGAGAQTIPSGTTYYIAAGNTLSGNVTFTDATSILCIEGTWTGHPVASPPGGVVNVNSGGVINNNTVWSYNGGGLTINNYVGGTVTIQQIDISGGTYTINNCADMTFTGATGISTNGGTFTINNYASININGTLTSSNSSFIFNNKAGSQVYVGSNFTFSAGTFTNDANLCVKVTTSFSGGTFTNNNCFRTTSYDISGSGAFTNNNYLTVVGNFTNSGTNNSNNGTMVVTGNYSGSGQFNLGSGSLLTCVGWSSSGTHSGPASGCAQITATGATDLSGTFTAANSGNVYFDDTGHPAAGWDSKTGTSNSVHINDNTTCTPTSYPACAMAGSACTTVLPITLVEFKAQCNNGKINLVWSTGSEINNNYFTIERSRDGSTYNPVGTVNSKAPGGNSNQTLNYSFIDNSFPKEESANNTMFYYRLKQTDFDGNYTYSYVSAATCSDYCIGNIAVTSDNNMVFLNISSICSTNVTLSIYNALGQIISTKTVFIDAGNNDIQLNANNIAQGIYILKANTSNQFFQKKFGKQQ